MREHLWKNNLNFAKDIPMMCAYCIITVIIVSEGKVGCVTFVPLLLHIRYLQQTSVCWHILQGTGFWFQISTTMITESSFFWAHTFTQICYILTPVVLEHLLVPRVPKSPPPARNCNSSHTTNNSTNLTYNLLGYNILLIGNLLVLFWKSFPLPPSR